MKKTLLSLSLLALTFGAAAQNTLSTSGTTQTSGIGNTSMESSEFDAPDLKLDKILNQPPQWIRKGVGGITLSQVSLTNWTAGGEGSLALDAILNYDAIYTNRRHLWQNRVELAYGLSNTWSRGTRKTNDKIYLNSIYGYRLSRTWYASLLGVFATQFANGYDYYGGHKTYMSRFMSPGYLTLGAGFTWRPNTWFQAYFSPATWRGTFVFDDRLFQDATGNMVYSPYGVDPSRHLYNEFGANVRFEVNRDLWSENFHIYSRLDLFSNYLHKPQNIDVRWYVLLTARISKWVSANLAFNMLYDDDIKFLRSDGTLGGSKLQVKEVLGIGLQTMF